ncbi:hypothetical protein SAMN05661012_00917 [Chitinophaga sancti]|uniref:Uncharacterized protein n=1 Tax=Chitinophaga sancti TaxID=1004 RepID=A0A1K1MUV2_9BACT|nr:hypothetical protein SAMN05661012_00917 [Chitinophaga sancti]
MQEKIYPEQISNIQTYTSFLFNDFFFYPHTQRTSRLHSRNIINRF